MNWPAAIPLVQYAAFPLVCLLAYFVRLHGVRLPRWGLALAVGCAGLAFFYSYFPSVGPARAAIMSPLEGDALKTQSRLLRERVNRDLVGFGQQKVRSTARSIDSHEQALELMKNSGLRAVVWGNTRWVRVAFKEQAPQALGEIRPHDVLMGLSELRLVTSVPSIGLSYEPRNETADFLAGILGGLTPGFAHTITTQEAGLRELLLKDTGQLISFWSNNSHRALAWWGMGNIQAFRALQQDRLDLGELRCAIDSYKKARGFLRAKDAANRDLLIAVINNLSVLRIVEQVDSAGREPVMRGKKLLVSAIKLAKHPSPYPSRIGPAEVARLNWQLLKGYIPETGRGKHNHKPASSKVPHDKRR